MADFPNTLQRDYGLKPHSKMPPMSTPRSGGAGYFSTNSGASRMGPMAKSRSIADGTSGSASNLLGEGVSESSLPFLEKGGVPSSRLPPLSRGAEVASGVDYDDVFGGPPRYAAAMFSSQSGAVPGMDEIFRSPAKVPSFRSSNVPVFELPVFGDEIYGVGGIAYGSRPTAVAYDDIFREGGTASSVPIANLAGSSLTGLSSSKPSSRSSSRRMSPVHPAASVSNTALDVVPSTTSSVEPPKARSIVGKFIRRCSFSSFSSFDESGGKRIGSPHAAKKTDLVTSSVPSSPPRAWPWDQLKRSLRSNSGDSARSLGFGVDGEVDDVFGGFPQRRSLISPDPFSDVQWKADVDNTGSIKTYGAEGSGKAIALATGSDCMASLATGDQFDGSRSVGPNVASSPSSTDEQDLNGDFIEIRMDRQNDPVLLGKGEGKPWMTVRDVSLSTRPTCKPPPARRPPAPSAQLKFKTWKDWAPEFTVSHPANFPSFVSIGSTHDSFSEMAAASIVTVDREESTNSGDSLSGCVEDGGDSISISVPEQSKVPATVKKMKARSAKEAVEAEERELQDMLANAWKMNERGEIEKQVAECAPETREDLEESESELHWKEWRKRLNRQFRTSQPKPEIDGVSDATETGTQSKEFTKCPDRMMTEEVKMDKVATEELARKIPITIEVVSVEAQDRLSNMTASKYVSGLEESLFREEMVKFVTDDVHTNSSKVATGPSPSGKNGTDLKKSFPEDVGRCQERPDLNTEEQALRVCKHSETFTSDQSSVNGVGTMPKFTEQNLTQDGKQHEEILRSEDTEDLDLSAGDICFSNGFEKIEGESVERTKSRWQRHVRARERALKALEEKQQRDAEVQREQAEKQRQAEVADCRIKRWATGKEGNLRALLSNLQHVLWSDSGWQPIPLTDLIEGAAVKKAYRKATLFVHPDKMQQKGATTQQKYVAERVFDVLQEAWKTYSSQDLF